jgi:prenyltransferase beta subunit
MLGTSALGEALPVKAAEGLRGQVLATGGWEWAPGWGADTNSTALALQALVAAGEPPTATVVVGGLAYLKSAQNADGGFAYALDGGAPGPSDANSTAYVVQALAAAGKDPRAAAWQVGGVGPMDYLLSLQEADGGFAWQKGTGSNQLATQQVIPALLGRAYPLAQGEDAPMACAGVFLPDVQR